MVSASPTQRTTDEQQTQQIDFDDSAMNRGRIPNLDGLRAVAILLVLFHHCPDIAWLSTLHANGRYGVALFFVISGFLITTLFLRETRRFGRVDLGRFFARRALRLFPLYYLVLAGYVVLVIGCGFYSPENQALFTAKLPSYLLYYSNLTQHATEGPFFFAWSLAVEEQFYLFFGVMVALLRRRWIVWLFAAALAAKMVAFYAPSFRADHELIWRIGFSYREAILWGVLLAYFVSTRRGYELFQRFICQRWVMATLAAGCLAQLIFHLEPDHSAWPAQLWYVAVTLLVGSCALSSPVKLLETRLAVHIGAISYGIYLMHMLVINTLTKFTSNPIAILVLATLLTTVLASLTYQFFEKPILRWKDRLQPQAENGLPSGSPELTGAAAAPTRA